MNNRIDRERRSRKHRRPSQGLAAAQPGAGPEAPSEPTRGKGRLLLVLLICLVGSSAASFVVFKYVIDPGIPRELIGTWQVTDGALRGATLEFREDGTAIAIMHKQGKKAVTNSSARVEGKQLFLTTRDDATGKDETVTQTIVELTAEALVIRDEDQMTYHMRRIRN
jgi:uncharacterized protein (TIGR03066 family)